VNLERVEALVRELLKEIGEDPDREGLRKTPARVARAYEYLCSGYHAEPREVINEALFETAANNMVIARDIEVYSLCEHHMLPFYGRCHIGYISNDKVLGVSKLARLVEVHARRLQIQERLTHDIAREIREATNAAGVGVVIECRHMCMMMRGVEKQSCVMQTSSVLGCFHHDPATRAEFFSIIGRRADW
jgi:GTP cyclohydrolase I